MKIPNLYKADFWDSMRVFNSMTTNLKSCKSIPTNSCCFSWTEPNAFNRIATRVLCLSLMKKLNKQWTSDNKKREKTHTKRNLNINFTNYYVILDL